VKDPVGRHFWPFYKGRDGCRSPMQWTPENNAGFSPADPWLPVHNNYPERNVANQSADSDSLLNTFRQLIQIRKAEPALQRGDFVPIFDDPQYLLAFFRTYQAQQILVVLNFSSRELLFEMPEGNWVALFGTEPPTTEFLTIMPFDIRLFKKTP